MNQPVNILGIESSCDETGCALVANGQDVLANIVASQIDLHARYGGVVPEIASRAHIEAVNTVISAAMERSALRPDEIAAVAVTSEPGLIGSLLVGLMAAKTVAWVWDVPLLSVNHVRGHTYAAALNDDPIDYPALALICSGGHTAIYDCRSPVDQRLLGSTIDDAAGEAFDKVASILHLGYPGGPAIEQAATTGDPKAVRFPRALLKGQSLDFSFSGLKTAVLYHVNGVPGTRRSGRRRELPRVHHPGGIENFDEQEIADIAASFQSAVVEVLTAKLARAARRLRPRTLLIGGGVAANESLRAAVSELAGELDCNIRLPKMEFCLDNAAMIAGLGYHYYRSGCFAGLDLEARATVRH